jgi:superfamily II DNA or RNA helicase
METATHGQIISPTGSGKSFCIREDIKRRLINNIHKVVVVVAPRILLANQLCDEFITALNGVVEFVPGHVHSGETYHWSSTKPSKIASFADLRLTCNTNIILFTTYNSLSRIVESEIPIDVIYYDEAHNAVRRDFFENVLNVDSPNYYFFTATPKHTHSSVGRGMNNTVVYGPVLANIPAPELVSTGVILPPEISAYEVDFERSKGLMSYENDRDMMIDLIDSLGDDPAKILVAAPSSKIMFNLLTKTDIMKQFHDRGYDVLHITSKYGAYVNRKKVNREQFFDMFSAMGKDPNRKFVMFHYSILSEGINVNGLTHTIFLRQLDVIQMAQTVGRVIRLNKEDADDIASGKIIPGKFDMYRKPSGKVIVPVFKNYGAATIKRLQSLVDTIFVKGLPAISTTA